MILPFGSGFAGSSTISQQAVTLSHGGFFGQLTARRWGEVRANDRFGHIFGASGGASLLAGRCLAGVLETDFPCFNVFFPVTRESFPATGPTNARALNAGPDQRQGA